MATTIDELDIEINASAKEAAKGIDALAESLKKLSGAFSSVDGLEEVASTLEKISNAVGRLSGTDPAPFTELTKALTEFAAAFKSFSDAVKNTDGMADAAEALFAIAESLDKLSDSLQNVSGITDVANALATISTALERFGNVNVATLTEVTKIFPTFTKEFKGLSNSLKSAGDLAAGTEALTKIANAVTQFGSVDVSSFTELSKALTEFSKAYKKLSGALTSADGITEAAGALEQISNAINQFGNVNVATLTELAKALPDFTKSFKKLADGLKSAAGLSDAANTLQTIADAISKFGDASTGAFSELTKTLPEFAKALKTLSDAAAEADKLDNAVTELQRIVLAVNAIDAEKSDSLVRLAEALNKLAGVTIESTLQEGISQLVEKCKALDEATVALWERLAAALSSMDGVDVPDVSGASDDTDDDTDSGTDDATQNTAAQDGGIGSGLTAGQQQATQAWDGIASAADSAIAGIGKALLTPVKLAGKFTALIGKGLLAPLKAVGKTISKIADGFKNFAHQVSQVVMYSTLYKVIGMITDALQEGIDNLYYYSDALDGKFAASMDSIATSAQYLGNSVAAMASPIFNALAPILDTLVDQFVELINMVNMFFASLTGASTTTIAKKALDTYADSADEASGSVAELEKTILGFDEINKLNDSSSGSGSGSGSGTDYSSMFEEVAIDSKIADFAEQLKSAVSAGDWEGAGTLLGEKVNSVVDSIDWDGIGSTVGYKINGVISTAYWTLETIDFENIGSSLATSINSMLEQIDTSKVGAIIARWFTILPEFLIGVIETLDFKQIAEKISSCITGYINEFTGWIESVDWVAFGDTLITSIGDFIAGIDFSGIASSFFELLGASWGAATAVIAEAVGVIFDAILAAFDDLIHNDDGTEKTGEEIWEGICDGIESAIEGVATWIKENVYDPFMNGLLSAFGIDTGSSGLKSAGKDATYQFMTGVVEQATGMTPDWVSGTFVDPIVDGTESSTSETKEAGSTTGSSFLNGLKDALKKLNSSWADENFVSAFTTAVTVASTGNVYYCGENVAAGLVSGIEDEADTINTTWANRTFATPIVGALKTSFDINSPSKVTKELGGYVGEGFLDGISGWFSDTSSWIDSNVFSPFMEAFNSLFGISGDSSSVMEDSGEALDTGLQKGITGSSKNVTETVDGIISGITSTITGGWDDVDSDTSTTWNSLSGSLGETWNGLQSTVSNVWTAIKANTGTVWNSLKSTLNTVWGGIQKTASTVFDAIGSKISSIMNGAKSVVSTAISAIKSAFNFSWSLPKLKLPHISIKGEFSLSPPSIPSFSVDWYKTGGIMDGATLFGMANGKLLGGGEAGAEAILPLENHNEWMDVLVDKMSGAGNGQDTARQIALMSQMVQLLSELLDKDTTVEVTADSIAKAMKRTNQRAGKAVFAVNT